MASPLHIPNRNTTLRRRVEVHQASSVLRSYMQCLGLITQGDHNVNATVNNSSMNSSAGQQRPDALFSSRLPRDEVCLMLPSPADGPSVSANSGPDHEPTSVTFAATRLASCSKRRSETLLSHSQLPSSHNNEAGTCCLRQPSPKRMSTSVPTATASGSLQQSPHLINTPLAQELLLEHHKLFGFIGSAPYHVATMNSLLEYNQPLWNLQSGINYLGLGCLPPGVSHPLIHGFHGHPLTLSREGKQDCLPSILQQPCGSSERCSSPPESDSAGESSSSQHYAEWRWATGTSIPSHRTEGDPMHQLPDARKRGQMSKGTSVGATEEAMAAQALLSLTCSS